jgi:hypothetical protein
MSKENKVSKIIDRVNKLLRVASRSNHTGEVEAAQTMAQELITRYQIDPSQLSEEMIVDGIVRRSVDIPAPYSMSKAVLLNYIAKHNFCKVLVSNDNTAILIGYPTDVELCLVLYSNILLHMISEMEDKLFYAKYVEEPEPDFNVKAWTKSFFGGYAMQISIRLETAKHGVVEEEIINHGKSLEIAIRDKQHAVEDYYQNIDREKVRSSSKLTSAAGYKAGVKSAEKADLNQTKIKE